jgi:hypothetical protein
VQQETDVELGRTEIVQKLPSVGRAERGSALEFDHHAIVDEDIDAVCADANPLVEHLDRSFALGTHPSRAQFNRQSLPIYGLEIAVVEMVVRFKESADHGAATVPLRQATEMIR